MGSLIVTVVYDELLGRGDDEIGIDEAKGANMRRLLVFCAQPYIRIHARGDTYAWSKLLHAQVV